MRKMTKSFVWLIPMMLIVAMVSGNFTPISNAMNDNKGKARAARTTEQRLDKVALRFGSDNTLLPVLMHAMERYTKGTPAESDIDRAFRGALAKHPNVNAQKLQAVVETMSSERNSSSLSFLVASSARGDRAKRIGIGRQRTNRARQRGVRHTRTCPRSMQPLDALQLAVCLIDETARRFSGSVRVHGDTQSRETQQCRRHLVAPPGSVHEVRIAGIIRRNGS